MFEDIAAFGLDLAKRVFQVHAVSADGSVAIRRKLRRGEAQIIGMIKEQEAGMPTAEVCRKHGLSQGTFYKYKSKYSGMEVSDVAKLKAMEDENARLKRLLAYTMLDNVVLKDLLGKN